MGEIGNSSINSIENLSFLKKWQKREGDVAEECQGCHHIKYCKGGCYYNALSGGNGVVDPYCKAYKTIFDILRNDLTREMQSESAIDSLRISLLSGNGFQGWRNTPISSLLEKVHPSIKALHARRIIAAHSLASLSNIDECIDDLMHRGRLAGKKQGLSDSE